MAAIKTPSITKIRKEIAYRKSLSREARNELDGFCRHHTRDELGLLAAEEQARRLLKEGQRQTQCSECYRWLWEHELNIINHLTKGD